MPYLQKKPTRMPEVAFDELARCLVETALTLQSVLMRWTYNQERVAWHDALAAPDKVSAAVKAAKFDRTKGSLLCWLGRRMQHAIETVAYDKNSTPAYIAAQQLALPLLKKLHADLLYNDHVDIEGTKEMLYATLQ